MGMMLANGCTIGVVVIYCCYSESQSEQCLKYLEDMSESESLVHDWTYYLVFKCLHYNIIWINLLHACELLLIYPRLLLTDKIKVAIELAIDYY